MWWRSAVNRSFLLCLAACRMRSSAWDTPARSCARSVLCWPAFPLVPALRSTGSAAAGAALFAGFIATISGSDFSCPCIIGYGSSPSRRGPDNPRAARSDTRSPRFRPAPFVRDGVLDHDGVSTPCMAAPHILPSALGTASASVTSELSRLNVPPHTIAVYASWLPSPAGHATLATGRVLALTRAGLSPAGPDQLILTHPQAAGHAQHTRRCAPLRGGLRPSLTAAARDALAEGGRDEGMVRLVEPRDVSLPMPASRSPDRTACRSSARRSTTPAACASPRPRSACPSGAAERAGAGPVRRRPGCTASPTSPACRAHCAVSHCRSWKCASAHGSTCRTGTAAD